MWGQLPIQDMAVPSSSGFFFFWGGPFSILIYLDILVSYLAHPQQWLWCKVQSKGTAGLSLSGAEARSGKPDTFLSTYKLTPSSRRERTGAPRHSPFPLTLFPCSQGAWHPLVQSILTLMKAVHVF